MLVDCDVKLTQLARVIAEKKGKHHTIQNLSQKLRNDTLNATEIEIIADALDYRLIFYPKDI